MRLSRRRRRFSAKNSAAAAEDGIILGIFAPRPPTDENVPAVAAADICLRRNLIFTLIRGCVIIGRDFH